MANKILFPPFLAKLDRYFATNHPVLYLSKLHYWLYYLLWAFLSVSLFSMAYTPQELPDEDLVLLVGNGAVGVGLLFWLRYEFWVSPERRFPLPSARQATLLFGLRWLCLALAFCLPYFALWSMQYEYRFSFTEAFNWAFLGSVLMYLSKFISWRQFAFVLLIAIIISVIAVLSDGNRQAVYFLSLGFLCYISFFEILPERGLPTISTAILTAVLPIFTYLLLRKSLDFQQLVFGQAYFALVNPDYICGGSMAELLLLHPKYGLWISLITYCLIFFPLLHKHFMRLCSKPE